MPCDAIATARAKISNETIASMITPEVVKIILRKQMEEKGEVVIGEQEWRNVVQIEFASCTVEYKFKEKTVTVQGGSPKLANEIANKIDQIGGLLLRQKLEKDIKAKYTVLKSERKGEALIISLEL